MTQKAMSQTLPIRISGLAIVMLFFKVCFKLIQKPLKGFDINP